MDFGYYPKKPTFSLRDELLSAIDDLDELLEDLNNWDPEFPPRLVDVLLGIESRIKPGKEKEGGPKADFCVLKTTDKAIADSFIFEKPDFIVAKVNHTFFVEQIVMPQGETDYAKIRELAKRKGKIIRKAIIDEESMDKEIEFEA